MIAGGTYTIEQLVQVTENDVTTAFDLDNATQILACIYHNGVIAGKYSLNAKTGYEQTIEITDASEGLCNIYIQSQQCKKLMDGNAAKMELIVYADNTNFTDGEINIVTDITIEKIQVPQLLNDL